MGSKNPPKRYSAAFRHALRQVELMTDADMVLVPIAPSAIMRDAGARAGRIPARTASVVYRAMIKAAQH